MALQLQNFTSLVQNSAAAVQGACAQLLDLTVGSVLRAILEANASVALWIQWLIVQVLALTRAATSTGSDLDTWMADYSLTRLAAVAATGSVTFSRFSTGIAALIVPGAQVKTADGTQAFAVTLDTTNLAWSASQGGYVIAVGTPSVTVPVRAVVAGSGGNVQAGTITLLASAVPAVDTVTNSLAFTNGIDAETDAAFRARFVLYVQGLARATPVAIESAVDNVQQGIRYAVLENVNSLGASQPGNFVVVADDGTGSLPAGLQSNITAAVNNYRPIGSTFTVQAPTLSTVNVSLIVTAAAGYIKNNMLGPIATAITTYMDSLQIGETLSYTKIAQIAWDATPGVANITSLTFNNQTGDVTVGSMGVIVPGTVAVN